MKTSILAVVATFAMTPSVLAEDLSDRFKSVFDEPGSPASPDTEPTQAFVPPSPRLKPTRPVNVPPAEVAHGPAILIGDLRDTIRRCWTLPSGWTDPSEVAVTLRFRLNRDGTVKDAPTIVELPASRYGEAASQSAVRAVEDCAPYRLPPAEYDRWSEVQIRFQPTTSSSASPAPATKPASDFSPDAIAAALDAAPAPEPVTIDDQVKVNVDLMQTHFKQKGVSDVVMFSALLANPFKFKDQRVILVGETIFAPKVYFIRMTSENEAIFSNSPCAGVVCREYIITRGVPTTLFSEGDELLLAVQVHGVRQFQNVSIPDLEFVNALFCGDKDCTKYEAR